MAQAAPKQPRPAASTPAADRFGRVAAGGPIADLQRTIEERLLAGDCPVETPDNGGTAHRLSRLAGPALLAATYVSVALWWF